MADLSSAHHEYPDPPEHRPVARAPRSGEELYRRLVESAGDIIYRANRGGYVTYANPAAARLTGYAEAELVGMHFAELVRPDFRESLARLYAGQLRDAQPATYFEFPILTRDGGEVWIGQNVQLLYEGGEVVGVQAVARDITDQREMQQALRDSEERFRTVVENLGEGLLLTDGEDRVLYANPAVEQIMGYSPAELVGRRALDVFLDADERAAMRERNRRRLGGASERYEVRMLRKDGRWADVRVIATPVHDAGGAVVATLGAITDVTEQKRAERALQESEARYRLVTRATNDVIWEWDIASGRGYWSEALPRVFGYPAERVDTGTDWWRERIHPEDRERIVAGVQAALEGTDEVWSDEYRFQRGDGSYAAVLDRGYIARDESGRPVRMSGALLDLTERKQAEEALRRATRRSEQLADRMQAVAAAAAGVVAAPSLEHLQQVLEGACRKVIALDAFLFGLYDEPSHTLHFLGGHDDGVYEPGESVPLAGTPSDRVVRERRSLVVHSSADPAGRGARKWGSNRLSESAIRTPILAEGRVLGLISVQSYTPGQYTADDVEVLETIAALAATAIVNIRLLSERRAAEAALRESEERFRLIVEGSEQVFFYVHDVEGRFEYLSPSVRSVLGYAAEELVGRPYTVLQVGDPSDAAVHEQTERALRTGRGVATYTAVTRHKDGRLVPVELVETPIVREGRVAGLQGFARDVTERRRAEEGLERSERYFRSLTENALDVIHVINADGTTRYLSPSVTRLLGYCPEEMKGRDARELIHPEDLPQLVETIRRLRHSGESHTLEVRVRHQDGSWRTFEAAARNLLDDPVVAGVVVNSRDVTERKQAEEENLRLAALSRENPYPVLECDAEGRPVHVNPAAEETSRELGMDGMAGLLPENHAQLVRAALEKEQGFQNVEVQVQDRIFSWTYRPHARAGVVHLFAVDITGRRLMEEQLRHDALHDALTGLPNRLLFMERLAHAILRAKRREGYLFAVLFLDLDRFKVINDSLGHHVGDDLLMVVAQRLTRCLRTEDTVARLGGDEFAILLESLGGISDATRVAERIQSELAAPVSLSGFDVFTSASIGIALSSSAYERPEYLLRNADMAMYRAKASGQARFEVFDRAMHADALARLQLETDLRRALERDEFRLHYQPMIDLQSGRIWGVEALIRWTHPDRGWMTPDAFIPVAEETGLILPIGRWVLVEACRQIAEWRDRLGDAAPAVMGVNLSAKQFSQPDLVEQIGAALEQSGLPSHALRLEITESAVMESADSAVVLLERLKALGVQISLDDFGTGYSSLSYLHRFPLNALKIDRSFVGRMTAEERSMQLVQTVLTLARSLGVAAVAEGIETAEQLAALRELGAEYGQGYLFSRPLDPAAVEALFTQEPRW